MATAFREQEVQPVPQSKVQLRQQLHQIAQDKNLTEQARLQQTFNAVRDFFVKNPAELTKEDAKFLATTFRGIHDQFSEVSNEMSQFLVRNYNPYYWKAEDVKNATAAQTEFTGSIKLMQRGLSIAITALESFGSKADPQIAALGGTPTTDARRIEMVLEGLNTFATESSQIQDPLRRIGEVYEKTEGVKQATAKYGSIAIGTTMILSGMWVGAALGVGIAGASGIGAVTSVGASQSIKGIMTGEVLTSKELFAAAALGAGLGALGHVGHAFHSTHAAKAGHIAHGAAETAEAGLASAVSMGLRLRGVGIAALETGAKGAEMYKPTMKAEYYFEENQKDRTRMAE
ncbi:MAG TPA: hypothetical protein VI912_02740 [Candidatus Bilamarchaeaceae archaeon]|nr:hypothetical protein [Candidatus Bilamarchaeaceae archaeon]